MPIVLRVLTFIAAVALIVYGFFASDQQAGETWLLCLAGAGLLLTISWWPAATGRLPIFNRTVLRWATLLLVAFVLISVQLVRVQVVESSRIASRVEVAGDEVVENPRSRVAQASSQRGSILDAYGRVLADTVVSEDGTVQRVYPEPSAAGLVGYYSPLLYGSTQVEAAYDEYLMGERGGNPVTEWFDEVLHRQRDGYDVGLTVDLDLQRTAQDMLGDRSGAAVVMDARSGAVLAMASAPNFDPGQLFVAGGQETDQRIASAREYWSELIANPNRPLLFRPTQGLYVPGSVFKTVTVSAALQENVATPETAYRDEGAFEVDGRVIIEQNRPDEDKAIWSVEEAYAYSLNVVFAQIGLDLGADALWEYGQRFGVGDEIPFSLPVSVGQMASEQAALTSSRTLVADTAFGQGQLLVSPLQMALVTGAVANNGVMMEPYVVSRVLDEEGDTLTRFGDDRWKRAISQETAREVRELMLASVEYGYASGAQIDGAVIGGKTGTAETGEGEAHSWFTGFAEQDEQRYVVSVIVERGGRGSEAALPIGRALLEQVVNGVE